MLQWAWASVKTRLCHAAEDIKKQPGQASPKQKTASQARNIDLSGGKGKPCTENILRCTGFHFMLHAYVNMQEQTCPDT